MVLKEFTLSHNKFCDQENTSEIELFKYCKDKLQG